MIQKVEVREYRIKTDRFVEAIEDSGYSFRTLQDELRRELRKGPKKRSTQGTSKSTLFNLSTGKQISVRRDVALAMVEVFRLKHMDRLFADDLYTVHREVERKAA